MLDSSTPCPTAFPVILNGQSGKPAKASSEGNGNEPTQVEVVSGPLLFKASALENVKTWRFRNPYTVDRNYETIFTYRLSGRELAVGETKRLTVTLESFHSVEIVTDTNPPTVTYGSSPWTTQ